MGTSASGQQLPTGLNVGPGQTLAYGTILIVLTPAAMAELCGGSAAMYRGAAGAASGYTNGLALGLSPGQALGQGLINGGLSYLNPVGVFAPGLSSAMQSSLNAGLASGVNQVANGNMPNPVSMLSAWGMRLGFGYVTGGISPADFSSAWSIGVGNGLFSASAKSTGGW